MDLIRELALILLPDDVEFTTEWISSSNNGMDDWI